MPRIPLGELENALRNPAAYRRKLDNPREKRFGTTYASALRFAIFHYHKTDDPVQARRKLTRILDRAGLTKPHRRAEAEESLDWYIADHQMRRYVTFTTQERVVIPLPPWAPPDLFCSGEVARVDVDPAGGYASWLLCRSAPRNWSDELRFPLIQGALAEEILGVESDEVSVGLIALRDQAMLSHHFSREEIMQAYADLGRLVRRLGY